MRKKKAILLAEREQARRLDGTSPERPSLLRRFVSSVRGRGPDAQHSIQALQAEVRHALLHLSLLICLSEVPPSCKQDVIKFESILLSWMRLSGKSVYLANMKCLYDYIQVAGLERLGRALFVEVLELRRERDRALESRTLWGHSKNLLGYLLSAYCLVKCAPIPVIAVRRLHS